MRSKVKYVKFLGKGAYGTVDLVEYTIDNSSLEIALKSSDAKDYKTLLKEFQIVSKLKECPRIVECLADNLVKGLDDNDNKVYKLLLEYASEGSLNSFMENNPGKLSDSMIRDFTRMILEGLVSIHGHGFVHCDLKSDNILVFPLGDSSYDLKIADFGLSLQVGEVPGYWKIKSPYIGAPAYMPPESLHDGVAKETLDLWSVGCLVLEMYTGENPWPEVSSDDLKTLLREGKAPKIPETLPCDARDFIETCFARNHEERGSAKKLLFHRFLPQEENIIDVAGAGAGAGAVAVAKERNSLSKSKSKIFKRVPKKSKDIRKKHLN